MPAVIRYRVATRAALQDVAAIHLARFYARMPSAGSIVGVASMYICVYAGTEGGELIESRVSPPVCPPVEVPQCTTAEGEGEEREEVNE